MNIPSPFFFSVPLPPRCNNNNNNNHDPSHAAIKHVMSELYDDGQLLSRGAEASTASDPNTEAASAALDTLFSSAAQGNYNLEIAIDPSLSNSAPAGAAANDQGEP